MTKIKLCGLTRPQDIDIANELLPDFIGFVFAGKSRRYVSPELALELKGRLNPNIRAVGVFVNEAPETVASYIERGIIDVAQLHGGEDAAYLRRLRALTAAPITQAFRVDSEADLRRARASEADYILLDNGAGGTGAAFDWSLLKGMDRPWFLAGGLGPENAAEAVQTLRPWAVDVSSGIETDGLKAPEKMRAFVNAIRTFNR